MQNERGDDFRVGSSSSVHPRRRSTGSFNLELHEDGDDVEALAHSVWSFTKKEMMWRPTTSMGSSCMEDLVVE